MHRFTITISAVIIAVLRLRQRPPSVPDTLISYTHQLPRLLIILRHFFGHIIRRDPASVHMATTVLDSTNTYSRPSSVPSRPSLSSVSCGAHSPYPTHVPPAGQTAKTWITLQRYVSVPLGTIGNHYGIGYSAELPNRQTSNSINFISATAVDPIVKVARPPIDE